MSAARGRAGLDLAAAGRRMHALIRELYPLPRSVTGNAVRQTLARASEIAPLAVREVPSRTPVLDWTVPDEWDLREAWFDDPTGRRVVDAADHSLHVVSFSVPFAGRLARAELDEHLHSLPEQPELIPYRASFYAPRWGFCLPHSQRRGLPDGDYEVLMDTRLAPGHLTYGEILIPGRTETEILISSHVCHPSLANDNLSAVAVALEAARVLAERPGELTWRLILAPGTIGAISWLARNREARRRVAGGLVISNLGDSGALTYKRSRRGDSALDRAAEETALGRGGSRRDFVPYGYDERQYCSPGFDLPVGLLSRTPWGEFPEYHTSADDPDFVTPAALADSLDALLEILAALEADPPAPSPRPRPGSAAAGEAYLNLAPFGEPQLGRRGLYAAIGGGEREMALLWILSLSDGDHSVAQIATRSGLPRAALDAAIADLLEAGLICPLADAPGDAWAEPAED